MDLHLERPIVFFDLETTGLQVGQDHIVQICLHKVMPNGEMFTEVRYVRPVDSNGKTVHIPEITTAIHGITDAMVANERSFAEQAEEIGAFIGNADLAGYNSNKFDVPLLVEEFLRANYDFSLKDRYLVDVQNIFHKMEQRTLKAAYKFYCNKDLVNAHSAAADTMATFEVLKAQLDRYADAEYEDRDGKITKPIVNDVKALSEFSCITPWADLVGHFLLDNKNRPVINFGKYKGRTLEEVFDKEPAYYDWMMKADFPLSTKRVATEVYDNLRNRKIEQLKMKFS